MPSLPVSKLEQPVHAPQAEVADRRAEDRRIGAVTNSGTSDSSRPSHSSGKVS